MSEQVEELCEWVELYALGALTAEEMQQFAAHAADCDECRRLVAEYRQVLDHLPLASEPIDSPTGMKERILSRVLESGNAGAPAAKPNAGLTVQPAAERSSVEREPVKAPSAEQGLPQLSIPAPRPTRFRGYISLGLAVAVLLLLIYTGQLRGNVAELKQQSTAGTGPLQGLKVNEAVTLSPAGEGISAKAVATLAADASGTHLIIQAQDLPELTGTEVYQVWLMKGDAPVNAGTFISQAGNGALYYTFDPKAYDTIAVTLEPDAAGKTPRGKKILTAPLKQG
ncbi:anti-sigma factor [Paenibacillus tritici]|uniref:Regulator of SigK n=1 Tax=Paenibacillus tritici TaxID=1873425 RepID=A0ABX2DP56_9BACL|nr:anti-sigma factor [Paenibacillus tritici]NQX46451.1 anti-sigma factor [Paenibacillus tritici]